MGYLLAASSHLLHVWCWLFHCLCLYQLHTLTPGEWFLSYFLLLLFCFSSRRNTWAAQTLTHWQDKKSFCSRNWVPLKKPTGHYENFSESSKTGRWAVLCAWTQEAMLSCGLKWSLRAFKCFFFFSPTLLLTRCHKEWLGFLSLSTSHSKTDFSAVRMLEHLSLWLY